MPCETAGAVSQCRRLLAELGDAVGEARNLAAGIVLMDDATLRSAHDHRLGRLQGCRSRRTVAASDRFLDFAHRAAQRRAPCLVDFGPTRDLARGFAGGLGIGHKTLVERGANAEISDESGLILQKITAVRSPTAKAEAYSEAARGRQRWQLVSQATRLARTVS